MVTDVDSLKKGINYFDKLTNFRLSGPNDRGIEKIPGYSRYNTFEFPSPVVNISQLVRNNNESHIFAFLHEGIYLKESDSLFSLINEDQTGFLKVRTVAYQDRLFCVSNDKFPFYISRDESQFDLNIYARLEVQGYDTVNIIDANNPTADPYKTITIPEGERDDTVLSIVHNDGTFIYIMSETWIYKFDYGNSVFDIVISEKILDSTVVDVIFEYDSFGVVNSGATSTAEYNYAFTPVDLHQFWHEGDLRDISFYCKMVNTGTSYWHMDFITPNTPRWDHRFGVEISIHHSILGDFTRDISTVASLSYSADQVSFPVTADSDYYNNEELIILAERLTFNYYVKLIEWDYDHIVLVKDRHLYVGLRTKIYFEYRNYYEYEYGIGGTWYTKASGGNSTVQSDDDEFITVKKYELDNDLNEVATAETISSLRTWITNEEADCVISNQEVIGETINQTAIDVNDVNIIAPYNSDSHIYGPSEYTIPVVFAPPSYAYKNGIYYNEFTDFFNFKKYQTSDEKALFYPYIDQFLVGEFAIRKIVVPGKPYPLKISGTNNGTYKFRCKYLTTLNVVSESQFGQYSEEVTLSGEDVDLYWANIPASHEATHDIQGLRIYALNTATEEEVCVYEVQRYVTPPGPGPETTEWQDGHVEISSFDDIQKYYEEYPVIPKCEYIAVHLDRLWLGKSDESKTRVYYSSIGGPENFPAANSFDVRQKDNEPLTGMISLYDRMIVFKPTSIYAYVGDPDDSGFTELKISEAYGCRAPDSIVAYKTTVIFLSYTGIIILDGNRIIDASKDIFNDYLNSFSEQALNNAFAIFDKVKKQYRLYIKDEVIVMDNSQNFWVEKKTNHAQYTVVQYINEDNIEKMLFSDSRGYIFQEESGDTFYEENRWAELESKEYKLSQIEDVNVLGRLALRGEINSPVILTDEEETFAYVFEPKESQDHIVQTRNRVGKTLKFKIRESSQHDMKINAIEIGYE